MTLSELALGIVCTYCAAYPGQPCVTSSGRRATYAHADRTAPMQAAWLDGYQDGCDEVATTYDDAVTNRAAWAAGALARHVTNAARRRDERQREAAP